MSRFKQKYNSVISASKTGDTFLNRLYIAYVLLLRPVYRRFGLPNKPCTFSIQVNNQPLCVSLDGSHEEFLIFDEILVRQEYAIPSLYTDSVTSIIDAGANIGLVSLFYSAMYPRAMIHAYEPNPVLFPRLQAQVAQCKRIVPHEQALGGTAGKMTFYVNPTKSISSSLVNRPGMEMVPYEVAITTLDEAAAAASFSTVDILQFDVEGAEYDMLNHSRIAATSRVLIGEIHEDLSGQPINGFVGLLSGHDVTVVPAQKTGRYVITAVQKS